MKINDWRLADCLQDNYGRFNEIFFALRSAQLHPMNCLKDNEAHNALKVGSCFRSASTAMISRPRFSRCRGIGTRNS